jgi:hypothetical protein
LLGCCLYYFVIKPVYRGIFFGGRRLIGIIHYSGSGQNEFDYEIEEENYKKGRKGKYILVIFFIILIFLIVGFVISTFK